MHEIFHASGNPFFDRQHTCVLLFVPMQGRWRWVATFGGVFLLAARASASAFEGLNRELWVSLDSTDQDQASGVSKSFAVDFFCCYYLHTSVCRAPSAHSRDYVVSLQGAKQH